VDHQSVVLPPTTKTSCDREHVQESLKGYEIRATSAPMYIHSVNTLQSQIWPKNGKARKRHQ
jgi:hypothetical protein